MGDIHGRADLADPLIDAIRADLSATSASRKVLVFLGDHVDRGSGSKAVIDRLVSLAAEPDLESHFIRGNHEDRMEAFLEDPRVGTSWCDYGGRDTLMSYGVNPPPMRGDADAWAETSRALAQALPVAHRTLLAGQESSVSIGDYFFTHAGARPGVALSEQSPEDLMWIRQAFLDHAAPFEQVIVHGHTPTEHVVSDNRRIGVDTGAYATNVLSAVRLEGTSRSVLQATGRGPHVSVINRDLPNTSRSGRG
ncbi:metallophosphoesterase family protein [Brevundimonas sp. R86498]|uniref:metallophosphoesterase family protein n=1 Tax=Brevundimonas sp. R86498 TaxID=3093845 RepID=UPI0037C6EBFD